MLWLCISLPQLPLEALQDEAPGTAVVVTYCKGNSRWVICSNPVAQRANIQAPMNYTLALALQPQLTALNRSPRAEQTALQRLAGWAYQFSSTVILGLAPDEPHQAHLACLWLEIGASLTLFGGFRQFMTRLETQLQQLRYTYQLGVGPTLEGAALLARAGIRLAIHTPHALFTRIRALPIGKLALEPRIGSQLHITGVRTIGALLELPRAALARRFEPAVSHFLDRLMGTAADVRPAFQLPKRYSACQEFEFEIVGSEALLFPLRRMLHEFAGYLRARDTAVQNFTLTLGHRTPGHRQRQNQCQATVTNLSVGMAAPERHPERFLTLVRERLERTELPAGTISLTLSADRFASPSALQTDLLNRTQQQTEEFSHTLDRLVARLGADNVHGLRPRADHRPEMSWASTSVTARPASSITPAAWPERPLWLLPEPRPLQRSVPPDVTSAPERIEAGWWDGTDVQRDYYIVRTSQGPDLWVYQDLRDQHWYLHGFWS